MKKKLAAIISAALAVGCILPMNVQADDYEPYRCMGDSNGDKIVDGKDASNVLTIYSKSSVGNYSISASQKQKCDVNCDGIVDGKDASEILSYYSFASVGKNTVPDTYYMKNMLKNGSSQSLIQIAENLFTMTCMKAISYESNSVFQTGTGTLKSGIYTYNRITDPNIKTLDDVYNDYYSLFATNTFLNDGTNDRPVGFVSSPNGGVYALVGGRGGMLSYQSSKITGIKSITANSVTFNVMSHYDDSFIGGTYNEDKNANFTLQLQNDGTLKVTEFTLPY